MSTTAEMILLCIIAGFLLKRAGAFLPMMHAPSSTSDNELGAVATVTAVAWSWLAPTSVMAVFIALSGSTIPVSKISDWKHFLDSVTETDLSQVSFPIPVVLAEQSDQFETSDLIGNRPAWTGEDEEEKATTDDIRRVVLMSHLWSTEDEAVAELQGRTAALVRSDFESRDHGLFDPEGIRFLSDDRAVELAVKEKYVERLDQDFGRFTSPMNRVWWQVELSPQLRTEILPAWKTAVVESRVLIVGTALAILTLLANQGALFARLKRKPFGSAMRAAVVTAGSMTAWIAAQMFVASQMLS